MRKTLLLLLFLLAAATGVSWWYFHRTSQATRTAAAPTSHSHAAVSFNSHQYSLTDASSLWVIVNKQHPLQPLNYAPANLQPPSLPTRPGARPEVLRDDAATALDSLNAAAKQAGVQLVIVSGYRSYQYQVSVYGGYVHEVGQNAADQESARPGYSEHQTGLAVDLGASDGSCLLEACFGQTPAGLWLAAHSYQYGFVLRYPLGKSAVTGYEYEPWHFRFVGTQLATRMHDLHTETLEEFFHVSGGTSY